MFEPRENEEAVTIPASLLRRNWYAPLAAAAGGAGGLALAVSRSPNAPFGWVVFVGGAIFAVSLFSRRSFPLGRAVTLRATPRALDLGQGAPIRVEDIVEAKRAPWPSRFGDHLVTLVLRDRRRIGIALAGQSAAQLLSLLGISAGERRTSFRAVVAFWKRFVAVTLILGCPWLKVFTSDPGSALLMLPLVPFAVAPIVLPIALVLGLIRAKVVIGAEGFATQWLFWRRFVPFSEVTGIRGVSPVIDRHVVDSVVTLQSGRRVRLRAVEAPDTEEQRGSESRALFAHLTEAHARWSDGRNRVEASPHLRRGGRSVGEWCAALERLVRGDGSGYRVATLTPEALTEVLRSADGPLDARAGAAAALVRIGDDTHRTAVRVAAEACVEPETRALLLDISDARSEGELHAVLERLDV
jgi:hypothetical protein